MIAQIVEVGWPTNVRVRLQTCVSVSAHTKAITSFYSMQISQTVCTTSTDFVIWLTSHDHMT